MDLGWTTGLKPTHNNFKVGVSTGQIIRLQNKTNTQKVNPGLNIGKNQDHRVCTLKACNAKTFSGERLFAMECIVVIVSVRYPFLFHCIPAQYTCNIPPLHCTLNYPPLPQPPPPPPIHPPCTTIPYPPPCLATPYLRSGFWCVPQAPMPLNCSIHIPSPPCATCILHMSEKKSPVHKMLFHVFPYF